MHKGGLFPPDPHHLPPAVFAFFPPGSMALSGTGACVAPPVAQLGPWALQKRGSRVPAERCPEAAEAGGEELGVGMAMAQGAQAAAGGMGS